MIERVQELSSRFPEVLGDNLQLVDVCMCFGLVSEKQASWYYLHLPESTFRSICIGGRGVQGSSRHIHSAVNMDEVVSLIAYSLDANKVKLPQPHLTYQWFNNLLEKVIPSSDQIYSIFYTHLQGSLTEHTAYSKQLSHLLDLHNKKMAIEYYPQHWKQLLSSRAHPLTFHLAYLKQHLQRYQVIRARALEGVL